MCTVRPRERNDEGDTEYEVRFYYFTDARDAAHKIISQLREYLQKKEGVGAILDRILVCAGQSPETVLANADFQRITAEERIEFHLSGRLALYSEVFPPGFFTPAMGARSRNVASALVAALAEKDEQRTLLILSALATLGVHDRAAAGAVIVKLADDSPHVRAAAARALRVVDTAGDPEYRDFKHHLLGAMRNPRSTTQDVFAALTTHTWFRNRLSADARRVLKLRGRHPVEAGDLVKSTESHLYELLEKKRDLGFKPEKHAAFGAWIKKIRQSNLFRTYDWIVNTKTSKHVRLRPLNMDLPTKDGVDRVVVADLIACIDELLRTQSQRMATVFAEHLKGYSVPEIVEKLGLTRHQVEYDLEKARQIVSECSLRG